MENSIVCLERLLHRVYYILLIVGVEAGPDHVGLVLGGRAEVHVHQAVVDSVVLRVEQMVISVEVLASGVLLR